MFESYAAAGLGIALIVAQRYDRVRELVRRADAAFEFPVLCDERRDVARRYGVWHPIGIDSFNTVHPASFLIDATSQQLRYAFVGRTQFARAPLGAILEATRVRAADR